MVKRAVLVLVLALLGTAGVSAQQPAAAIRGRVVSSVDARPVPRANIVVAQVGGGVAGYRTAITDDAGAFLVSDLRAGTYRVYAQRDGFLPTEYGKRPAGSAGVAVTIGEGQRAMELTVVMTPTAVIAGRVLEEGRPVVGATVRARNQYAITDDRGEYRLFDLPPGSHIVSAQPPWSPRVEGDTVVRRVTPTNANGNRNELVEPLRAETLVPDFLDPRRLVTVFYPGTTDRSAALPVAVRAGDVVGGIDLALVRVEPFRVAGHVDAPAAHAARAVSVRLFSADGAMESLAAPVAAGRFQAADVPAGRYHVSARSTGNDQPSLFGRLTIPVDRDITDLVLPLREGMTLSGRVLIDGAPPTGAVLVNLNHAAPGPGLAGYSISVSSLTAASRCRMWSQQTTSCARARRVGLHGSSQRGLAAWTCCMRRYLSGPTLRPRSKSSSAAAWERSSPRSATRAVDPSAECLSSPFGNRLRAVCGPESRRRDPRTSTDARTSRALRLAPTRSSRRAMSRRKSGRIRPWFDRSRAAALRSASKNAAGTR